MTSTKRNNFQWTKWLPLNRKASVKWNSFHWKEWFPVKRMTFSKMIGFHWFSLNSFLLWSINWVWKSTRINWILFAMQKVVQRLFSHLLFLAQIIAEHIDPSEKVDHNQKCYKFLLWSFLFSSLKIAQTPLKLNS